MFNKINLWFWKNVSKIIPSKWLKQTIKEAEDYYKNKKMEVKL
jgi:hypothetical protein